VYEQCFVVVHVLLFCFVLYLITVLYEYWQSCI